MPDNTPTIVSMTSPNNTMFKPLFPTSAEPNWMPAPEETIPGCPPGLEYLTKIDQLLVHQQVEVFEGTK